MVLMSKKTATPLAALVLSTPDRGCMSMMTSRPSPPGATEDYFQGMLNMPDQPIELSIINLCDDLINFNILHVPHKVMEVDPGPEFGINSVNELYCGEAYTIRQDQRTKRQMILSGKTRKSDGTNITVGEDEKQERKEGVYFYLSVVPTTRCPEMVELFAEGSSWKCLPHIVLKDTGRKRMKYQSNIWPTREQSSGYFSMRALPSMGPASPRALPSMGPASPRALPSMGPASPRALPSINQPKSKKLFDTVDVSQTQACELKQGAVIDVTIGCTNVTYAWDNHSDETVLCLSIWRDMMFYPLPDRSIVESDIAATLVDYQEYEAKKLRDSLKKVYKSDTCVVDLTSPADVILLRCGHQCVNRANVGKMIERSNRCPMCREHITATILVDQL